jgi:hypothetical protein
MMILLLFIGRNLPSGCADGSHHEPPFDHASGSNWRSSESLETYQRLFKLGNLMSHLTQPMLQPVNLVLQDAELGRSDDLLRVITST